MLSSHNERQVYANFSSHRVSQATCTRARLFVISTYSIRIATNKKETQKTIYKCKAPFKINQIYCEQEFGDSKMSVR